MALSRDHSLVGAIMKSNDPYEILGVSKSSNKYDIDRSYKWTMTKVHPDKNSHPLATKAAQKVNVSRDILLNKSTHESNTLSTDISEIYVNVQEELARIIGNLKALLFLVPFLTLLWFVHLLYYLSASEWSLVKSPLHTIIRKTPLYRVKYYALSGTSPEPAEHQVLQEYLFHIYDSCKNHLNQDPWYNIIFSFPEDDFCTEGKTLVLYVIGIIALLTFSYNYYQKRTVRINK